jgi:hypothetical protein
MHSYQSSRQRFSDRQDGVALIVTLMIMMLVSALMVGFVAAVVADQRAAGLDRDQTQAYAAAHAGMEQLTSDLSNLFVTDFSPNATQISSLRNNTPALTGFTFVAPGGGSNSGYMVEPRYKDVSGNPLPESASGSMITSGPYQGFKGIITPYDITITARSTGNGGAEVRMRRTLQTVAIPVFQFGMFSETDLAFHAGAEDFMFGGRVHTNGNLFLAAATGGTLTITDRITAVGEVIRTNLPNGLAVSTGYTGAVKIPTTIASNPVNNVYRGLASNEGSLTGTLPKTTSPNNENPTWYGLSTGTYKSNIRNGTTGAKRLDLPLVADLDSNGVPDAAPIELIRRPGQNSNENTVKPIIYVQRYYAQAGLRILLSDTSAEIMSLPTIYTAQLPVDLSAVASYGQAGIQTPLARTFPTGTTVDATLPAGSAIYKSSMALTGAPLIGGWIKIEAQKNDGTYIDVTTEILNLGITGRSLVDRDIANPATSGWNVPATGAADTCWEPAPNAVIRLQRVRDVPVAATNSSSTTTGVRCGVTLTSGNVTAVSTTATDYWPLALYDTREGQTRDGTTSVNLEMGGVMQYVELDVNNLRRWLAGTIGANGTQVKNDNGYIIYFSDRRGNKDNSATPKETGEYGYEDVINLTNTAGTPNGTLDTGEDVNASGALDTYGGTPRFLTGVTYTCPYFTNVTCPGTGTSPGPAAPMYNMATATAPVVANWQLVARANRTLFFRRALKLVNGTLGNLPTSGLTVSSENPVYVEGDYNASSATDTATTSSAWETTNVPAAILADAVTLLSKNWNDIVSFTTPNDAAARIAKTTKYRMAIVTGKTQYFPQPSGTSSSFGSDGGAHNFVRSLEDWANPTTVKHRYRGSLVSFFISRQAIGSFKCCSGDAYNRGDRDWSFDTDFLLPSKLPPGTPMFRDVNTLTFRQLLRPTQ